MKRAIIISNIPKWSTTQETHKYCHASSINHKWSIPTKRLYGSVCYFRYLIYSCGFNFLKNYFLGWAWINFLNDKLILFFFIVLKVNRKILNILFALSMHNLNEIIHRITFIRATKSKWSEIFHYLISFTLVDELTLN